MKKAGILGKKTETQSALRAAIFTAVRMLEENIDEPPSVAELAERVGLSRFHFQRTFREVVGETVAQHASRLRLENAAAMLKYSSWQVGDIGLACGFSSQTSFNRGFKRLYGVSPLAFRKENATVPFLRGHFRLRPKEELPGPTCLMPTVALEKWDSLDALCLRFYGKVGEIYKAWAEVLEWCEKNLQKTEEARFLGLWFDDWSDLRDDANYRYECAVVPVDQIENVPEPFFRRRILAGKVAVARAHGRTADLERAWKAFGQGWLPYSGFQPRGHYVIDEYPVEVVMASLPRKAIISALGNISIKMCIPVQDGPLQL
ncbi:MAG: AraC family transcriptional regulator [Verrucomicrobiota bacterium]